MTQNTTRTPGAAAPKLWGLTDEEFAQGETVYRAGLLKDKVFVITGGGTGMGRAMAFLLARLGASVLIAGRNEAKLEDCAAAVKRLTGAKIHTFAMSIREPDAVEALLDHAHEKFGGIDTLVNNAGGQFPQDAIDFSRKGWSAVIDLNLNGTWWMMQEAAKRWKAAGAPGNIISIVANVNRGMPQAAHTCAARAGVIALSRTLAVEWAPLKIRVNCLAPGAIATAGLNVYPDAASARFHHANPMKVLGDGWDIAQGVVYLAAGSGKFITGETLTIDGGMQFWGTVWPAGRPEYFKEE